MSCLGIYTYPVVFACLMIANVVTVLIIDRAVRKRRRSQGDE